MTGQGRVAGKVAIVTGGASGLGRATAERLAQEGAIVVATDIAEPQAAPAGIAAFHRQDVRSEDGWKALVAEVVHAHGGLDILVNNAGVGLTGGHHRGVEDTALEDWRTVQEINVEGVWLGCKHAMPALRDRGGGAIVNLSSVAALMPTPFLAAYGASKAAVEQLSRTVALHGAPHKVRCCSVHPGQIVTPMLDGLHHAIGVETNQGDEQARAAFLTRIPLGVYGEPIDIANAVLFLVSDEARHITGLKMVVDGGMMLL
ncbi:SDR family NAD(P)-dependent oxidoreductase [Zavarzinia sp. CC-PAN008]|uniref:SDR family NAD(P)-dependent oxidoreductase n=1 Tax=Zavarzinia sp. CC-PAN008 TaxID=3243332 RepID=UPI003F744B20